MNEKIYLNKDKVIEAKKILIFKNKKVFSTIFNLFEDDIKRMLSSGYSRSLIIDILSKELETDIKYITFIKWFDKNIKQKNQNSNTLRNNSQVKKGKIKKEVKQEPKQNNNTTSTKKEDNKPWWEERLEVLAKGMEEAALRL